jgi:hypothetical protein
MSKRAPKPEAIECTEAAMRDGCRWPICDCQTGAPPAPIFAKAPAK